MQRLIVSFGKPMDVDRLTLADYSIGAGTTILMFKRSCCFRGDRSANDDSLTAETMDAEHESATNAAMHDKAKAEQHDAAVASIDASTASDVIDEGLFSRQLGVLGFDAMRRMATANVLLVGLKGLGVEIAKNLILGGLGSVTLLDSAPVELRDLGSQFFLAEAHVGQSRANACVRALAALNTNCRVEVLDGASSTGDIDEAVLRGGRFQLVIATECGHDEQLRLNALCRVLYAEAERKAALATTAAAAAAGSAGSATAAQQTALDAAAQAAELALQRSPTFIAADVRGLAASCFVDLGSRFVVSDTTGEQPVTGLVASISHDEHGVVLLVGGERHGLTTGDYVTFEEVEGMSELNQCAPRRIRESGPYSFAIGDTRALSAYVKSGRFVQVKQPATVCFESLAEQLRAPTLLDSPDMSKFARPTQLHYLFRALSEFQRAHGGRLPRADCVADAELVVAEAKRICVEMNQGRDIAEFEFEGAALLELARGASASIGPMCAFLGGLVVQEAMKAVSGKFMPIRQYFYYDALEAAPSAAPVSDAEAAEYAPIGGRYDDYIAVFGRRVQALVQQQRLFLVGAGAIGCEMLKNWAMMGAGTAGGGRLTVTDMDAIERSNLSRQFLFRNEHIGQQKSLTAARAVQHMNAQLSGRVHARTDRMAPDTEEAFDERFWSSVDGVCTALDNVEARLYVDAQCVRYHKPLLESGTLGTKGNTQVIVPFLTTSYGAGPQDPPEKGIPYCSEKFFPQRIEHTIQWARSHFEGWFTSVPTEGAKYAADPEHRVAELARQLGDRPAEHAEALLAIRRSLVDERPRSFDDCIAWARLRFEQEFHWNVRQLLLSCAALGPAFWASPKREPTPLEFDARDPAHMAMIVAAANIRARVYGIAGGHADARRFAAMLSAVRVRPFEAAQRRELKVSAEGGGKVVAEPASDEELVRQVASLTAALTSPHALELADAVRIRPAAFEKDDDTNHHIDFVTACSNLRARGYRIKEESRHEIKLIAGKIIPAIATTTGFVAGLVALELYKVVQQKPLEAYRCAFANLALPVFSFSEPSPPDWHAAGALKWSLWDRAIEVDCTGGASVQSLLDRVKELTGLEVASLTTAAGQMLYSSFFGDMTARLGMSVAAAFEQVSRSSEPNEHALALSAAGTQWLSVECMLEDDDAASPVLRVRIA